MADRYRYLELFRNFLKEHDAYEAWIKYAEALEEIIRESMSNQICLIPVERWPTLGVQWSESDNVALDGHESLWSRHLVFLQANPETYEIYCKVWRVND